MERLTYENHEIVIEDGDAMAMGMNMPKLTIDGEEIMVMQEKIGGYSAPMLNMFAIYPTMKDLAKALIDISPVYLSKTKKRQGTPNSFKHTDE